MDRESVPLSRQPSWRTPFIARQIINIRKSSSMTIGGNTKVRIFYRSVRLDERGKFGQTPQCDATLSECMHRCTM